MAEKLVKTYAEEMERREMKSKREETKEEAERAAGDDREKDPDYIPSEEGSSLDPL